MKWSRSTGFMFIVLAISKNSRIGVWRDALTMQFTSTSEDNFLLDDSPVDSKIGKNREREISQTGR